MSVTPTDSVAGGPGEPLRYGWQHLNFGNALARSGRLREAIASYDRALSLQPDLVQAYNNRGEAHLDLGSPERAAEDFQRAIETTAGGTAHVASLAAAHAAARAVANAAASAGTNGASNAAVCASAHANLGRALLQLGRYADAEQTCRRAVHLAPGDAAAHNTLGNALVRVARPDEAIVSFQTALVLNPRFIEARLNLGNVVRSLGRPEEALQHYEMALKLDGHSGPALTEYANTLRLLRRTAECEAACAAALRSASGPDSPSSGGPAGLGGPGKSAESVKSAGSAEVLAVLAELRADQGEFVQARELFERAIQSNPQSVEAWAGLTRIRRMTNADSGWIASVEALVGPAQPRHPGAADQPSAAGQPGAARQPGQPQEPGRRQRLSPRREMTLRYAMGKYYDDINDIPNAFANIERANELAKQSVPPHDREHLRRAIDLIIRSHDAHWCHTRESDSETDSDNDHTPRRNSTTDHRLPSSISTSEDNQPKPIFIVGMPRSGTSLAEQILASHPAVFGAGELSFWSTQISSQVKAALAAGDRYLTRDTRSLHSAYRQLLNKSAARVVDKMPTNFFALGLIHTLFPQGRIIHLQRHPIDTCLSIYFQHFESANAYSHDLEDLADYYRGYQRLMAHWRAALPTGTLLEVPYEALVANTGHWIRTMLEFLDLPWDPRCMESHLCARTVVTASKWQVRQPITPAAVGRWARYRPYLKPLLSLIDSADNAA